MARNYLDFSLGFESTAGGGYLIRAASSRAEAESVTELPFNSSGSGVLGPLVLGSSPAHRTRNLHEITSSLQARPAPLELIGRTLFAALFPGPVGELYTSESNAAMVAGHGLRIRLHLRSSGNPELAWLTRVPWELIFDNRAGGFPCLNPLNPLVRHLDLPRPVERIPFRPPIRVLVAAANPADLPQLGLQDEWKQIEAARTGRKRIEVKVLEGASPEELRRELIRGKYQIVHFMGHGLVDSDNGSLVFSTEEGESRLVAGREMSHLVQGGPSARLVILNACSSAAAPESQGADPLAGVAGSLVRGGQPAVIGMQFDISDASALTFSETLYERLSEGDPIEAAVAEARLAVYLANPNSTDWVAPVLFLRGADSRLKEERVKRTQPARDIIRNHVVSEKAEGGEIEILGAAGGSPPRTSRRPRSIYSKAEITTISGDKITIAGSKD